MAAQISSTQILGTRLLKEIENEEGTLEELLKSLRTQFIPASPSTGLPDLDALWLQHGPSYQLNLTGRPLPLLHALLTTLLSPPHNYTITLIDLTHRFTPSHLSLPAEQLKHLLVFQCTESNFKVTLDGIEEYMLYGDGSTGRDLVNRGREWWGTVVVGGSGGKVNCGWRGWLRVEREGTGGFGWGVCVEEALGTREERRSVVEDRGWRSVAEDGNGGEFVFK